MAKTAAADDDRGLGERLVDGMKEWWANLHVGEGHAAAMGRLGMKELRNAASLGRESVQDTEIGLYGTKTQGEIAQARGEERLDAEQEKVVAMSPQVEAAQPEPPSPSPPAQEAPQQGQGGEMSVLGYPLESGGQGHAGRLMEQQQSRGRGR